MLLRIIAAATVLTTTVRAQTSAVRPPVPGAPAEITAFVDVAVIPMDSERVLTHQTVLVQHGWITALGPAGELSVPAGAVRIDGRDQYLIPGLADMHAHFLDADSATMVRQLFLWLADGTTTVRSMDYTSALKGEAALRMRRLAGAGALWSPRIYASAPWTSSSDKSAVRLDSVAAYVAQYKANGYDHIKLYTEHGPTLDSLVAATRRLGVPLVGHVPSDEPLERVLAARIGSIEHLTGYHKAFFDWVRDSGGNVHNDSIHSWAAAVLARATQQAGVWNTPTLALLEPALKQYVQRDERRRAVASIIIPVTRRLVKTLSGMGAGLLLGTDKRAPKAIHHELQALVQAGLTPYQALATGTRNVSVFYGTLAESGTVETKKRADLVLLAGNPLEEIRNTERLTGVMIGGRWLSRSAIDQHLAARTTPSP